jgi:hypothetical protein
MIGISKVKFISGGKLGMEIEMVRPTEKGGLIVNREVKEKVPLPMPKVLRAKMGMLKYYLLHVSRYWRKDWDQFLTDDKDMTDDPMVIRRDGAMEFASIWNDTEVNGFSTKGGGVIIMGSMEVVSDKRMSLTTPLIQEQDDPSMFGEILGIVDSIKEGIKNYYKSNDLSLTSSEVKEYLALMYKGDEDANKVFDDNNDEQNIEEMARILQSKGHIVIPMDDVTERAALVEDSDTEILEVKGKSEVKNGSHKVEEAQEEEKEVSESAEDGNW